MLTEQAAASKRRILDLACQRKPSPATSLPSQPRDTFPVEEQGGSGRRSQRNGSLRTFPCVPRFYGEAQATLPTASVAQTLYLMFPSGGPSISPRQGYSPYHRIAVCRVFPSADQRNSTDRQSWGMVGLLLSCTRARTWIASSVFDALTFQPELSPVVPCQVESCGPGGLSPARHPRPGPGPRPACSRHRGRPRRCLAFRKSRRVCTGTDR